MRIDGISSKKFGDPNEEMLDNKNLFNDKELFDDADLDWYDYGFRNYDPQIGRFTQLDPLTDKFPELTPYQYASDEPIANVDMDGLEGYVSLEPVLIKAVLKAAPKVSTAAHTFSAISIGMKAFKVSTAVIDHTGISKTVENPNLPISEKKSIMEKINDWFRSLNGTGTIPVGNGSHQRVGYVIDGNEGTTDNYTDKADFLAGNIHMGPFFKFLKMNNPLIEEVPVSPTVKKVTATKDALEAVSTTLEGQVGESIHKSKINKNSDPNYIPQELKMFRKDSISKTKDTFHIIYYKYVSKK